MGHDVQVPAPANAPKVPAPQAVHEVELALDMKPCLHVLQAELARPEAYWPIRQVPHVLAPTNREALP